MKDKYREDELLFKPDDHSKLFVNKNRVTSRNRIEIFPYHRKEFDLISFIDFAISTYDQYYVDKIITRKDKTSSVKVYHSECIEKNMLLFKRALKSKTFKELKEFVIQANEEEACKRQIEQEENDDESEEDNENDKEPEEEKNEQEDNDEEQESKDVKKKYAFLILFGPGLSSIRVFVKNNMDQFTYRFQDFKINIALKSNDVDFSKIKKDSLIFHVIKYFSSRRHDCHPLARKYIRGLGTFSKNKKTESIEDENNVQGILNFCPGFIKILYQKIPSTDDLHYHNIVFIIIVFPWSIEALKKCNYVQLDSSFKGMKPYAYCVSHGIIYNESIPLSITIAPSECKEIYSFIFDEFDNVNQEKINWSKIAILSDMHPSIISACNQVGANIFFCHHHIIRYFGSNYVLGFFVDRLLKCYSFAQYDQLRFLMMNELNEYLDEKKNIGELSSTFQLKVNDLKQMLLYEDGDPKSNFFYTKWALWIRRDFNMTRCSNHQEGFHAIINKSLGLRYSFTSKLSNLISCTIRQANNFNLKQGDSIKRKRKELLTKVTNNLAKHSYDAFFYCSDSCDCEEDLYNYSVYRTQIPCRHMLLHKAKKSMLDLKNYIDENKVNIHFNDILHNILESSYVSSGSCKGAESTAEFIMMEFEDITDTSNRYIPPELIIKLVVDIGKCFNYALPFSQEITFDSNIHDLLEDTTDLDIQFDSRYKKSDYSKPLEIKISAEEQKVWTTTYKTLNQKIAKLALYETITEITTVYDDLKGTTIPFSLCFDEFTSVIDFKDDLAILNSIPAFKVRCWKAADKYMNNNKFFK